MLISSENRKIDVPRSMLTLDREKSKLTVQQSIPDSQNENLTVPYTVGRDFYIVSSSLDFF